MTKTEIFNGILAIIGLVANIMGIISFISVTETSSLKYSYALFNVITFYSIFVITWIIIRKKYKDFQRGKIEHRASFSIIKTTLLVGLIFIPIQLYIDSLTDNDVDPFLNYIFLSVVIAAIIKYFMSVVFNDMELFLTRNGKYVCNEDVIIQNERGKKAMKKNTEIYLIHRAPFEYFAIEENDTSQQFEIPINYLLKYFVVENKSQTND